MRIFIATHKKLDMSFDFGSGIYSPLLVGAYKHKDTYPGYIYDNTLDNISEKNDTYCELTGVYWIYKNSNEDIVGLCHYRRFFTRYKISKNPRGYLNSSDLTKIFKNNDVIVPKKIYYKKSLYNSLNIAPNKADMKLLREVIADLSPEYLDSFDSFMKGNGTHLFNMLIAKRDVFNSYSSWMFKILNEVEARMDPNTYMNDPYRRRMFGFLSERLLNIYLLKNKSLRVYEANIVNTADTLGYKLKNLFTNRLKQILFKLKGN